MKALIAEGAAVKTVLIAEGAAVKTVLIAEGAAVKTVLIAEAADALAAAGAQHKAANIVEIQRQAYCRSVDSQQVMQLKTSHAVCWNDWATIAQHVTITQTTNRAAAADIGTNGTDQLDPS
ncbi:hypothetical protein H4S00_006949, partial [Coemansia sp. D1744]